MVKIIWLTDADKDLIQIYNYISKDSIYYAEKTIKEIVYTTENLLYFPYMGRKVSEMKNDRIREVSYKSYRIIYEISNNCIYIHRVAHKARILYPNFI